MFRSLVPIILATFLLIPVSGVLLSAEKKTPPKAVNLAEYQLKAGPVVMKGVSNDASGLTYNPLTKSLFMVINGAAIIMELDLEGKVKRKIKTVGFRDIEGIVHTQKNEYYVVEEGRGNICRIEIEPSTEELKYSQAKVYKIDSSRLGNKGLEGLTWDSKEEIFFAVKEKNPRKLYKIKLDEEKKKARVTYPLDFEKNSHGLSDLAGIHYDKASGNLLLLSHESCCVVEMNLSGKEVSRLSLRAGKNGLKTKAPQAEGITMDDKGNLYICSEPNLFYRYEKKQQPGKRLD